MKLSFTVEPESCSSLPLFHFSDFLKPLYPYVAPRLYMCVVSKWQWKAHMNVLRLMNVGALLFRQRKNKLNLAPLLKLSAYRINFPFLWHCASLQVWLAPHESFFPSKIIWAKWWGSYLPELSGVRQVVGTPWWREAVFCTLRVLAITWDRVNVLNRTHYASPYSFSHIYTMLKWWICLLSMASFKTSGLHELRKTLKLVFFFLCLALYAVKGYP